MTEVYKEHKAVGTSYVVFSSLNTFLKGQPEHFRSLLEVHIKGLVAEFLTVL